ncbi:MAG: chemotaxis protein CheD [Gemmatimonadota bacterium]|nr:chemotaxis protein CheD [Gemmatimonadota bacterium]
MRGRPDGSPHIGSVLENVYGVKGFTSMPEAPPVGWQTGLRSITVDISAFKVSNDPEEFLITYSLGSCLGLTVYDPIARVAGMVHCMLPLSKIDPDKARRKPGMFVDTGVPALLNAVFGLGARKERLILKAAGCGKLMDDKNLFRIGERNHTVLRKILWKNNMMLDSEDVGGNASRTVRVIVGTGDVILKSGGREVML